MERFEQELRGVHRVLASGGAKEAGVGGFAGGGWLEGEMARFHGTGGIFVCEVFVQSLQGIRAGGVAEADFFGEGGDGCVRAAVVVEEG